MKLLYVCAALAMGEACGLLAEDLAPAWSYAALASLFVALFGYGRSIRGWHLAAVFLAGLALAGHSQLGRERLLRSKFWLRDGKRYERRVDAAVESNCLWTVKADVSRRIGLGLEHDRATANLNRAILLGERRQLPRNTKRVFVEAGTMHVFAISGLHVMLVSRILMYVLLLALVPFRWIGLAAIPLLWTYVYMIGLPPSAVRAAAMASFYYAAPMFWRRPNLFVAWELTFLAVHLLAPGQLFNVGSALSFAVMLAIALWCNYGPKIESKVLNALCISAAAWVAGVPIAAHVFGRVTPGGLVANLILIPTAMYSVTMGVLGVAISYVSETIATHFNNASALLTELMVGVSTAVASLPWANFEVAKWSVWQCVEWYALVGLVVYLVQSIYRRRHVI